jgi:hypothetical protein
MERKMNMIEKKNLSTGTSGYDRVIHSASNPFFPDWSGNKEESAVSVFRTQRALSCNAIL